MTIQPGSMARDGGWIADRVDGQQVIRCPVVRCHFAVAISDLGELLLVDITEDDLRRHLEAHPPQDWLRTIADRDQQLRNARQAAQLAAVPRCCALEAIDRGGHPRFESERLLANAEANHDQHTGREQG